MNIKTTTLALGLLATSTISSQLSAHCQVPCGIYSDATVLTDLQTHFLTIEKAMKQISELSADTSKNANQITRWVTNKEEHATKIQETMQQYFLAQRIKLDEKDKDAYVNKLTLSHQIIVYAMKCKQGTDLKNAASLKTAIDSFTKAYKK